METIKKMMAAALIAVSSLVPVYGQNVKEQEAFYNSYTLEYKGEYLKAAEALKKGYDEKSYEINIRSGWVNYEAALYTESQKFYQKAIDLQPNSIEAKLGYIYPAAALGNKNQVTAQYIDILKIDPQNSSANYQLGLIYYYKKDNKAAFKYFEKVVSLYPFGYDALLMFAWTNFQLGRTIEATDLFNKVLLLAPSDKSALEGLSLIK